MKIKKITIITIILVILIIISLIQGVQINNIKEKLSEGGDKTSSLSKVAFTTSNKAASKSNTGNLPQMVGGC